LEAAVRAEARSLYESYETFPFTKSIGINPFEALWAHFSQGENENFRKLQQLAPSYRLESWTRGLKAIGIDDIKLGQQLADQFPRERRQRPYVYEETFAILDKLKGNVKLLLLTNGSPDLQKEKLAGVPLIAPYFDHIIISGEFGIGKPDPTIFQYAMELLRIRPEEGIMVGDKLTTDILGSNRVGMPNAWVNRHGMKRSDEIVPQHEIQNLHDLVELIYT
jgi:putative hydrolase of the HAD superfamily